MSPTPFYLKKIYTAMHQTFSAFVGVSFMLSDASNLNYMSAETISIYYIITVILGDWENNLTSEFRI
jgi:hypothetical protein